MWILHATWRTILQNNLARLYSCDTPITSWVGSHRNTPRHINVSSTNSHPSHPKLQRNTLSRHQLLPLPDLLSRGLVSSTPSYRYYGISIVYYSLFGCITKYESFHSIPSFSCFHFRPIQFVTSNCGGVLYCVDSRYLSTIIFSLSYLTCTLWCLLA